MKYIKSKLKKIYILDWNNDVRYYLINVELQKLLILTVHFNMYLRFLFYLGIADLNITGEFH